MRMLVCCGVGYIVSHMVKWLAARGTEVTALDNLATGHREFLHVDDLADAAVFLMQHYSDEGIVNVGVGEDVTIRELAQMVSDVVGFEGRIVNDTSKPDGTPRKLLDVSRLHALGWQALTPLREGLEQTYRWFLSHQDELRA
jgi:GDP-L-fucose synthase